MAPAQGRHQYKDGTSTRTAPVQGRHQYKDGTSTRTAPARFIQLIYNYWNCVALWHQQACMASTGANRFIIRIILVCYGLYSIQQSSQFPFICLPHDDDASTKDVRWRHRVTFLRVTWLPSSSVMSVRHRERSLALACMEHCRLTDV